MDVTKKSHEIQTQFYFVLKLFLCVTQLNCVQLKAFSDLKKLFLYPSSPRFSSKKTQVKLLSNQTESIKTCSLSPFLALPFNSMYLFMTTGRKIHRIIYSTLLRIFT
jgi:hypothetical protein